MGYMAKESRYDTMQYNRCGASGLKLPMVSLGFWHNFGDTGHYDNMKAMCRTAFDNGITHFDLANNYGPAYGSAERNLGQILRDDFSAYRDELLISTKAGYDMWPGPYGNWGSRKYLIASLDASLKRLGLDYVDIFIITAWILRHRSKRRWALSIPLSKAERRSMSVCPTMTVRHWNVHVRF